MSGHNLLVCLLYLLSSTHFPSTLSPLPPLTKCYNGNRFHQIKQVPASSPAVHSLLSIVSPSLTLIMHAHSICSRENSPSFFRLYLLSLSPPELGPSRPRPDPISYSGGSTYWLANMPSTSVTCTFSTSRSSS